MKKFVFVCAVLLLFFGFDLFFFFKTGPGNKVHVADFLPTDVLFYGEQQDFTEMYRGFVNSRLGRAFSRIDYPKIAAEFGGDEVATAGALKRWQKVHAILSDPGFDQVLGKEFSLALFPARSFSAANPAKALEERLLLVARPRYNVKLLQFLAPYVAEDIEQSTVQYGSHTITRYPIDDRNTVSTATVAGLVLAAIDERLVRKSLDVYDDRNQGETLAGNSDYQRLRSNFKGAQVFQYVSLSALMAQGKMIAGDLPEKEREQFLTLLEQWDGWGGLAYGAWTEEGLLREKIEILYDTGLMNGDVAAFLGVQPAENETLPVVPADTLLYYWTNSLDLPLLWRLYSKDLIAQRPGILDLLQQELRDSVGMGLEEILAMLANECAIIVKGVDVNGIPIPKAMLMVQLTDPQKFMDVFDKLLRTAEIPLNTKQFQEHDISYWGIAPQDGLQPAFTLFGDYLLLSNSRNLVKQVVALKKDPEKNLLQNPELHDLQVEFMQHNNSTAYVHIASLADAIKKLAVWAGGMAVLQGPETARKVDVAVKELVLPLLDGMTMYRQLASRSAVKKKSILVETTILVVE